MSSRTLPPVRAAAVQMEGAAGDKEANFARMESMLWDAAGQSVQLIVFPECCITGDWFIRRLSAEQLQSFEHPLIRSGNAYTVFDTPFGLRLGVLICYDNNVNENGRITALMEADVILAPHQTGGCRTSNPHLMGLFSRETWMDLVAQAGFTPRVVPLEHASSDFAGHDVFLGLRPEPAARFENPAR